MEVLRELTFVGPKVACESRGCFALVFNMQCNPLMETVVVVPNLVSIFRSWNRKAIRAQCDTLREQFPNCKQIFGYSNLR